MIHGMVHVVFPLLFYKVHVHANLRIVHSLNVNSLFHSFKMPPVTKDSFERLIYSNLTLMKGKVFYSVLLIFVVSCFLFNLFFFPQKKNCILCPPLTCMTSVSHKPFFDRNSLSEWIKIY